MKCSRCKREIESYEIKFAREGEMGKPLCRKCKAQVEEESREKYREGLPKQRSSKDHYGLNVYRLSLMMILLNLSSA